MLAMKRAVEGLEIKPELALIDGNKSPELDGVDTQTVVKGDAKSQSIAAASILAKVARDRYMKALDEEYPRYRFSKHKGYGTKLHYEMIEKFGVSPVHRPSFLKKVLNKFVEVKTRKFGALISGEQALTAAKRRHIIYAAERFLGKLDTTPKCRFDAAVVEVKNDKVIKLKYYINAFDNSR